MKRILLILTVILAVAVAAQERTLFPKVKTEAPDMEQIRRNVTDRTSPYFYPRLIEEFQKNDTVMKLDKYRHLYLGYLFQEDYDPYRPPYPVPHRVQALYSKEKLTRAEADSIIRYAILSLSDNPLDCIQIQLMINALKAKGNVNLAKIWEYKLRYILMAIESTGTGLDEENAWYIIETQHEYVLLNQMGYRVANHVFYDPCYEYITVEDAGGRSAGGFYFNIGNLIGEYFRKHPEEIDTEGDPDVSTEIE
ncbi:MAG: DUF4919 domain-containing protein [Clostridium sp.]|nr:DUF4919 domain-containing protein [Clostridium sp.]